MSSESRGSRDNPGNSTSQEAPVEAAETDLTSNPIETMNLHRSPRGRGVRSKSFSSRIPDIMQVTCGHLQGELHVKRIGSGSRSPCIHYNDAWLTPNQFEFEAGKTYLKNWQWAIRHGKTPLHTYVKRGLIKLHGQRCDCSMCSTRVTCWNNKVQSKNLKVNTAGRPSGDATVGSVDTKEDGSSSVIPQHTFGSKRGRGKLTHSRGKPKRPLQKNVHNALKQKCSAKPSTSTSSKVKRGGWAKRGRPLKSQHERATDNSDVSTRLSVNTDASGKHRNDQQQERWMLSDNSLPASSSTLHAPRSQDHNPMNNVTGSGKEQMRPSVTDTKSTGSSTVSNSSRDERSRSITTRHDDVIPPTWTDSKTDFVTDPSNSDSRYQNVLKIRADAIRSEAGLANRDVESWTVDEVTAFLIAAGFRWQTLPFREQVINGEALLRLREDHLVNIMKIKLGTSLRLISLISYIQTDSQ